MLVDYQAKRSLKAGHSVDTYYQFTVDVERQNRQYRPEGKRNISLSGNTVDVVHRRDVIFDIQTAIIKDTSTPNNDDLLEFLDSVSTGEEFDLTIDAVQYTCILNNYRRPYVASRIQTTDLFKYSFTARVI